jgi:hypothetical protein
MTKERKESATWYIAATHFLTAGFVVPLIANLLVGFVLDRTIPGSLTAGVISLVVSVIAVWFGVAYSARYLEKAYIIPDPSKVIRFAIGYYVGLYLLSMLGLFAIAFSVIDWQATILQSTTWLASVVVFYVASKKFVKATAPVSVSGQESQIP